jgi:predicted metal-dependent hydrolase
MAGDREGASTDKGLIKQIIRSKRRTLALQVTPDASLIVRAPEKVSEETIFTFVQKKIKWILHHQKLARESFRPSVKREFVDGERFLYLGEWHTLFVIQDVTRPIVFNEKKFLFSESFLSDAKQLFEQWYRKQAYEVIKDRVRLYAETAGLSFKRISITGAWKRWGSCEPKGTLNFSWRLIMAPMKIVDYVIVHELVHLEERNHSRNFREKVRLLFPNYQQAEMWLKDNRWLLNF